MIRQQLILGVSICALLQSAAAEDASDDALAHQACPQAFHSVPIFPQSSLCLSFDDDLPASMTYHARADMQAVENFYTEQLGDANDSQQVKGRRLLTYADGMHTIVISDDGSGSQVDILVKG